MLHYVFNYLSLRTVFRELVDRHFRAWICKNRAVVSFDENAISTLRVMYLHHSACARLDRRAEGVKVFHSRMWISSPLPELVTWM